jgi:ABC-type multidrug transport system ATPase subunit
MRKTPTLILNNQGQTLSMALTQPEHRLGRDPSWADLVVPPDWSVLSRCHARLRQQGDHYFILDGDGQKPSSTGLFIQHRRITVDYYPQGYCLQPGTVIQVGQNPKNLITLTYDGPGQPATGGVTGNGVSLQHQAIVIGRDSQAQLCLDAPSISRRHAVIEQDARGRYMLHDYSTNGIFIDGVRVNKTAVLPDNSVIRLGPYLLRRQGDQVVLADSGSSIRLDAYQLMREVQDEKGIRRRILNEVSLAIEPGQFVALVGGSGAGKSTLMTTLLGTSPTTSGFVLLNGEDLRKNFNIYRTEIGYVPQDDIIHRDLTVLEVLSYAARLRLPSDADIRQVVSKTLTQIEMVNQKDTLVKKLSGGQRKRVSIGVELLADPKLFFLDEPTSGLDPGLDQKMMHLLRKLADEGRTVILVTHATNSIRLCDRVVFMGRGGRLCYFGSPDDALAFFADIPPHDRPREFADLYTYLDALDCPDAGQQEQIREQRIEQTVQRYKQSSDYHRYIGSQLNEESRAALGNIPPQQVKRSPLDQLTLLSQRLNQLLLRDHVNLGLALFTAPIAIGLITLALGDQSPFVLGEEDNPTLASLALRVLFVFTCAGIWVGIASSLQEIVKEAAIYTRERLVNLGLLAYLGSKSVIFIGLGVVQALLMTLAIIWGFTAPEPSQLPWPVGIGITSFLTLYTAMCLGLMVSAFSKNGSQANSALPLLLVPQIVFAGVLFDMDGAGKILSWLMLSRWSIGAYASLVDVNSLVPTPTELPDGSFIPQPFEPTSTYDPTWENLALNWGLLLAHSLLYLAITAGVQKRKDIL